MVIKEIEAMSPMGSTSKNKNVIDFSWNTINEEDTYVRLLNISTFDDPSLGIGLKKKGKITLSTEKS